MQKNIYKIIALLILFTNITVFNNGCSSQEGNSKKKYGRSTSSYKSIKAFDEIAELEEITTKNATHNTEIYIDLKENKKEIDNIAINKLNENSKINSIEDLIQRIKLDENIKNNHQLSLENKKNIWQTLITQDKDVLLRLIDKYKYDDNNHRLSGWLELAVISKNFLENPSDTNKDIINWSEKYSDHPAKQYIQNLDHNLQNYTGNEITHKKIAILLPLSGNLAPAAKAIKQGILTAYYQDNNKPELIIIDTENKPSEIINHYNQAISKKADVIIGPLNKESLNKLSNNDNAIPVLGLNYASDDYSNTLNNNLYQFGISAEDEATQVATKSWKNNLKNTLIIVDNSEWGRRVSNAYREKFEDLEGTISHTIYLDSDNDLKKLIYSNLSLDKSQKRKNTLQWIVGGKLEFEPRRRQDYDNIFLATSANRAKQIKPILKFYYSDNIPIYATSNILNFKSQDNSNYKDLANIEFCDIPLIIHKSSQNTKLLSQLSSAWPSDFEDFIRLYALGIDSYNISKNLSSLREHPELGMAGYTGHLILNSNGKIHRHLPFAKISNYSVKPQDVLS